MGPERRLEGWLVVLAAACLAAWLALALDVSGLKLPAVCSAGSLVQVRLPISFDLALALNAPAKLAADWALMVAAMMAPLVIAPLRHLRDRSFARRRGRATLLFIGGYLAAWLAAGVAMQAIALLALSTATPPLLWLGLGAATALCWQVSPAKQWCLNRCHRQPHLAAFGAAADGDAAAFGMSYGASCVGACWALMGLTLFVGQGHVLAMIAVTLFVFAERLESPEPLTWRWRGPGKALRIAMAQARMSLAPWIWSSASQVPRQPKHLVRT